MNKRRWIFLTSFVAIFALGGASSFLFVRECVMKPTESKDDFGAFHAWAHTIGLTKDQEAKIEPLEKSLKQDIAAVQKRLAEERMALCRFMHEEPINRARLDRQLETICELEKEQQKRVVNHLLTMKTVLTPEQNDRFYQQMMTQLCPHCRGQGGKDHKNCEWCSAKHGPLKK